MIHRPLLIALCLAGTLTLAPPANAAKRDKGGKGEQARGFVEQSAIVAPRQVGDFVLEGSQDYPDNKFAGVQFRYVLPGHEEMRIDVFVYPHGDMPEAKALETGLKTFRTSFDEGMRLGYFGDLKIVSDAPFRLDTATADDAQAPTDQAPAAASSPSTTASTTASASAQQEDDSGDDDGKGGLDRALAERLAGAAVAKNGRQGQRLLLSYRIPDPDVEGQKIEMRSMGYLFYRQLYLFKGRISAASAQIGDAEFQALADRAMRTIVPAIQVFNSGTCGQVTISVGPPSQDREARAEEMVLQMLSGMNARVERNCSDRLDTPAFQAASRDAEVRRIEYDPGDWGSGP